MVESMFDVEAMKLGLGVAIPVGDNYPFDRIVIVGQQLIRIQIKSTNQISRDKRNGPGQSTSYRFNTSNTLSKKPYTKDDCDFICCFIIPLNRWYIFPVEAVSVRNIRVYPHDFHSLNEYKEAWQLIKHFNKKESMVQ